MNKFRTNFVLQMDKLMRQETGTLTAVWLTDEYSNGVITAETFNPVVMHDEIYLDECYGLAGSLVDSIKEMQDGHPQVSLAINLKNQYLTIHEISTGELVLNLNLSEPSNECMDLDLPTRTLTSPLLRNYPKTNRNLGLVEALSNIRNNPFVAINVRYISDGNFFYLNWEGGTLVKGDLAILVNKLYNDLTHEQTGDLTLVLSNNTSGYQLDLVYPVGSGCIIELD